MKPLTLQMKQMILGLAEEERVPVTAISGRNKSTLRALVNRGLVELVKPTRRTSWNLSDAKLTYAGTRVALKMLIERTDELEDILEELIEIADTNGTPQLDSFTLQPAESALRDKVFRE